MEINVVDKQCFGKKSVLFLVATFLDRILIWIHVQLFTVKSTPKNRVTWWWARKLQWLNSFFVKSSITASRSLYTGPSEVLEFIHSYRRTKRIYQHPPPRPDMWTNRKSPESSIRGGFAKRSQTDNYSFVTYVHPSFHMEKHESLHTDFFSIKFYLWCLITLNNTFPLF